MSPDVRNECERLALELAEQPEFFGDFSAAGAAISGAMGSAVATPVQRYTGERSSLDDERCLRAGAMRLRGCSDREIERTLGCTRRSIAPMLAHLERTGRITPLRERVVGAMARAAEATLLALARVTEEVVDGARSMEHASLIRSLGGNAEKLFVAGELAMGRPTGITASREMGDGAGALDRWLAGGPVIEVPTDSQSIEVLPVCEDIKPVSVVDAVSDAVVAEAPGPDGGTAGGGGGGVRGAGADGNHDGLPASQNCAGEAA